MKVNQLKAGAVFNYMIIALNAIVGLLYTPILIHSLGQSEYGLYSLVVPVVGYLTLLDFGFGSAVIRYTAKFRAEGKQREQYEMWGMFLVLYCIIAVVAFLAGLGLYFNIENLFGSTMTEYEIGRAKILTVILVFNLSIHFPFAIFGAILTAYEEFVFQKAVNILRICINTSVMIILLSQGYKSIALVVVQTVLNIATMILNLWYCYHKVHIKIIFGRFNWSFLKEVAIFSFWIFLNAIMDRVYWSTGQFVLGAVSGTIAVSVFAVGIHFESMYMTFSTAISSVFLPKVSRMVAQGNNHKEISDLFIRTGRIQFLIMSLILFGFILFGKTFIRFWAGAEYGDSYIITVLFFAALIIPLIQNVGITILMARNQMKFRSLLYIVIAAVSLIGQIILSKAFGAVGCAVSITLALLIGQGLIMNIYYKKRQFIDIVDFWRQILCMSIAPVMLTIASYLLVKQVEVDNIVILLIMMAVYVLIYCVVLWIFSMNKFEKKLFLEPVRKVLSR